MAFCRPHQKPLNIFLFDEVEDQVVPLMMMDIYHDISGILLRKPFVSVRLCSMDILKQSIFHLEASFFQESVRLNYFLSVGLMIVLVFHSGIPLMPDYLANVSCQEFDVDS